MNKSRVEAFTDAVVAIVLTIMVLEFHTPDEPSWHGLIEEWPYFFSYILSFFFICVAWYNHHYMFTLAPRITKSIFWANNLWLLTMSFIPVATAWAGQWFFERTPQYFYFIIFILWSLTYVILSKTIILQPDSAKSKTATKIRTMTVYRMLTSPISLLACIVVAVLMWYFPPSGMIFTLIILIIGVAYTPSDSDNLYPLSTKK